jgi:hypothetical protein
MDIDTAVKIVGFIVTIVGLYKVLNLVKFQRKSSFRDEYNFAKMFLADVEEADKATGMDKKIHPYVEEKGYQAIAGTDSIRACEAAYILSLKDPVLCLRYYVYSKSLFENFDETHAKLSFKSKYSSKTYRYWRKKLFFVLYFIFGVIALNPLLNYNDFGFEGADLVRFYIGCIVVGVGFGWLSINDYLKFDIGEDLINSQKLHTPKVTGYTRT